MAQSIRKDTRWDRIRKRHTNQSHSGVGSTASRSETVRRLIEMDFIGSKQQRMIEGSRSQAAGLNPALVMDMRHKMFRDIPHKLPLATVAHPRNIDKCVAHNLVVENRYISHQLAKFRRHLQKERGRNQVQFKMPVFKKLCDVEPPGPPGPLMQFPAHFEFDHKEMHRSLDTAVEHIRDFYVAPHEAQQQVRQMCAAVIPAITSSSSSSAERVVRDTLQHHQAESPDTNLAEHQHGDDDAAEELIRPRTPSSLTPTEELLRPMREAAAKQRSVRFGPAVEVVTFSDSRPVSGCSSEGLESNTSDGIDSVISDLAEEALLELQLETAAGGAEGNDKTAGDADAEAEVSDINGGCCKRCSHDNNLIEVPVKEQQGATEVTKVSASDSSISALVVQGQCHALVLRVQPKAVLQDIDGPNEEEDTVTDTAETVSNQEQSNIIRQLFQARTHTNAAMLRQYFRKWIHFTTIARIGRDDCRGGELAARAQNGHTDRVRLINTFLDKIRREKGRLRMLQQNGADDGQVPIGGAPKQQQPQVAKRFRNKIKVQQDIIDLQRLKLERQERLIMELKLSKLSEEARAARQELKDELKTVIRCGDAKAKAKARCLQLIGNLRDTSGDDEEDEAARIQARGALLVPKFLQHMQERALERSVRHEQARQRRLHQDAEKEAHKIAAEEAKRLEDEETKRQRLDALREKRRQEKMFKVMKERERLRALENRRTALDFWRRMMLRRIGMEGFKRLIQRKRDNQRKCEAFRRTRYKEAHFLAWHGYCQMLQERKRTRADDVYFRRLKRHAIACWRVYVQETRSQCNVAIDWYELRLSERSFNRWLAFTKRMMMVEHAKMGQAVSHHEWHLKWKVLDCWQRLPQILQLDKETEERRQRWRLKIWELLPDYTPNRDDLMWN